MYRDIPVLVQREVEAALIPSGEKVMLQPGSEVYVTQSLGNAYTLYVNGNLVRVAGKDGDALGLVVLEQLDINAMTGSVEDKTWMQLKTCFDPEIPVNIVDLGLVYSCEVIPLGAKEFNIKVTMTLTAPACGMGPVLVTEAKEKIMQIQEVKDVNIELVFDPPWERSMMTDEAKLQLGLL